MKVTSGKKWGADSYICDTCGKVQTLADNEEELKPCDCGSTTFDSQLEITRSDIGLSKKADEILNIIAVAIFLVEALDLKEFINVISTQLRILLIDGKSLLKLKAGSLRFHPCTGQIFDGTTEIKTVLYSELFDYTAELIPIDKWQKQEIAWSKHWKPITIYNVIHAMANKNGGTHVDKTIPEDAFMAIEVLGESYILEIAKYVMKMAGRNYKSDVYNLLLVPYEKFKNKKFD